MSIESTCLLVKMKISFWDGFKKDNNASETVDKFFRTEGKAGNYSKRLFDKSVLKPIRYHINRIKEEHGRMTMPWCYDGVYILPNNLYFQYTEIMRNLSDALSSAVDNMATQYPVYVAAQRNKLGDLFNSEDYPHPETLKEKYAVSFKFFPVPDASHFLIDIENQQLDKLKADLTDTLYNTQKAALNTLYKKVLDLVDNLHERLDDPKNVFHESLLDNLDQLVSVLPGLNVFDDDVLNKAYTQLREKVLICDAKELRDNSVKRREVAANAFDVAALLRGH